MVNEIFVSDVNQMPHSRPVYHVISFAARKEISFCFQLTDFAFHPRTEAIYNLSNLNVYVRILEYNDSALANQEKLPANV